MSERAKELRIIYLGTPEFAVAPLRRLVEGGYNVVGVVTAPDRPAGRGQRLKESDVKRYALGTNLPIFQPEKLQDPEFLEEFKTLKPDLGIVVAFRMLPEAVWNMPHLGTFNLHASLLPQYRGAAPINWAIINGETKSGVTTFMLDSKIDTGDILYQREVEIAYDDTAGVLHDKLMYEGADLVLHTVNEIAEGRAKPVSQPKEDAELKSAPKIYKDDCKIDWSQNCVTIHNFIRGLSPYPAAWSEIVKIDGSDRTSVRFFSTYPEESEHSFNSGHITVNNETMKVACSDGFIVVDDLQMTSKKRMSAIDFLNGFRNINSYYFE